MLKAIPLTVFSNEKYRRCSNGGISERYDEVLLIHERGFIPIDMENPPENLVKVVCRIIGRKEYMHLEPLGKPAPGHVGWMAGGSYAGTSDGRFTEISPYPLSIHDRQETQEFYDMMD